MEYDVCGTYMDIEDADAAFWNVCGVSAAAVWEARWERSVSL